ncbi:16S rRNA (guanine(966)-N(2))-methyltransferase RsmD [Mycoplasmatota bacterium WC30]
MLRIIGGFHKSRKIKEVSSKLTRPTTDRNKEAIFNILGQYFDGGVMVDLFSGSGALGIEAISRGIDEVDFVENNNLAINTIKENLNNLKITEGVSVIKLDVFDYLNTINKNFDLIIADPPYALNEYDKLLDIIASRQLLNNGGIIVFEADKNTLLLERKGNIIKYKEKVFGNTKFAFYTLED